MDRIYLLECKPYDPVAGVVKNAFFSAGLTSEADLGTSDPYPVRLIQSFSHETSVFEENAPGQTNTSIGSAVLQNTDGRLDYLLNYTWDNREVKIKSGERGDSYSNFDLEFVGAGIELTADQNNLVLTLKDNSYKLLKDLQQTKFLGSGAQEGGVELKNRRKPLLFGKTRNLSPVLIDVALLTSQIHDGALTSVDAVFDRGVPLTFFQNYATYALLAAATIPPGNYATCLAQGYLRLGAPPVGIVTVDAVGEYGSVTNIPELVKQVLFSTRVGLVSSEVNVSSFTEASSDCPFSFEGIYLAEPDFQVSEFIETMASAMNAFWYVGRDGQITFRQFKFRTPSVSIRAEDLMSLGKAASPSPLYRVRVNYAKNATIMSQGDFTVPIQTFNGYLTKRYHYVDVSGGEIPGNYANAGQYMVFLNDVQVNDFTDVQFRIPNGESWITIDNLGVITVTNSGVPVASALVRASIGEFSIEETFTLVRDATAPLQSMALSLSSNRFFFNDANAPEPTNQTITITATGTNTTAPITITAKDNLNQTVALVGNTIPIANVSISPLVFYIEVTASDANGVTQKQRISVQHGVDAQVAATLEALAASNKAVTFFYRPTAPTTADGLQVDDVWVDTDDGNKQYRWTGSVWSSITDTRVTDALTAAAGAQATADGKVKTYFSETAPTQPPETLALGDLWYKDSEKTLYRWNGTNWSQSVGTYGADFNLNVYGRPLSEVFIDEMRYNSQNQFNKRWNTRQGDGIFQFDLKDSNALGGNFIRVGSSTAGTELVTNGTFPSNTTGWTASGATLSQVGGQKMRVTTSGAAAGWGYQAITCIVGKSYLFTYDSQLGTSTGIAVQISNDIGGSSLVYNDTTQRPSGGSAVFVAQATTQYIRLGATQATASRYCDFDNISVKEMSGETWMSYKEEPVPFDPAATYEIEVAVRRPAGDGRFWAGIEGVGSDGVTIVDKDGGTNYGNPHWIVAQGVTPAVGTFTVYKGYLKGRAATGSSTVGTIDAPSVVHNNVIFIRPIVVMQWQATNGYMELSWMRIRKTQTMDQLPEGSTWGKMSKSQLSNYLHKLTVGGSGMLIGDQRNLPAIKGMNLGYKMGGTITYSTTTTNCAVSVSASVFYLGSLTINYNATSINISGSPGTGPFSYYLYFDDAGYSGGTPSLQATTDPLLVYQSDSRVFLGSVTFSFPSAGTGGGDGGGGGGGCVDAFSWIETPEGWKQAKDVVKGDKLRVLTRDHETIEWAPVRKTRLDIQPSVLLATQDGRVRLQCSTTTPLTLKGGAALFPLELEDQELPVLREAGLSWEKMNMEYVGHRPVALIDLRGKVFAAAIKPGNSIFTHNAIVNKP